MVLCGFRLIMLTKDLVKKVSEYYRIWEELTIIYFLERFVTRRCLGKIYSQKDAKTLFIICKFYNLTFEIFFKNSQKQYIVMKQNGIELERVFYEQTKWDGNL